MNRKNIPINTDSYPTQFRPLLEGASVYDSSCSPQAQVLFIDRDRGYYLKCSEKGSLKAEADLTAYFHQKGLAAEVLAYRSLAKDWLLTERVPGEDATHAVYLADPTRLCDTVAELLRQLHETKAADCPVQDRTATYLETAARNYRAGMFDPSIFPAHWGNPTAEEAWCYIQKNKHLLKNDTLIHGDYCLPNLMLENWKFSGFIDLGNGGVGDRHIDLFWGAWSLMYNLKTDAYRERFFDAYGRDRIDPDVLKLVNMIELFG